MSSLTIEMGLRRKRGNSPPVPNQIASRDDVTLAQKQRLAVLAKMGLGPVGGATQVVNDVPHMQIREFKGVQPTDRKAALLEKERRFREQEERQQEQEAQEEQERRAKRARSHGAGISRLGPVQPREDDIPQFLPAPMQVPPPKPLAAKVDNKMEIKISKETADRAKGPQQLEQREPEDEEDEETKAEDQVLAFLRMEKAKRAKAAALPPAATKQVKKKKKRKTKDGDWDEWAGGDEEVGAEEDFEEQEQQPPPPLPLPRVRDGGFSKQIMVVESVKGKVSTANRNLTDLDLERRFSMQENQGHGSLMTEEEVLRMIRKEKQEKGSQAGSASRRVQRELAEWAAAKEQQRARVKSPHRFERMVVSRK
mmetsp:Transcript_13576/g.39103  ORF Transcript_13576/g.39103 Transcript_13576/m.39103 type:complete len:367 (-) Transcript_13576:139-1239(-)